ncbi:MAG: glycosyltransferase family 4 protein [Armatimonadetes bacterium]|nr:glycosyltransferase family 4 protein [Armatimonadota bacterium]
MRSLLLIHSFAPVIGGVQTLLHEICRHARPGSIEVLSEPVPGDRQFDASQPYSIHRSRMLTRTPWIKPGWLPAFRSAARLCRQRPVSLLQFGVLNEVALTGVLMQAVCGVPYLVYTHGLDILVMGRNRYRRWLRRLILGRATRLVAVSGYVRETLISLGVPPEKISVIHPGVEAERFRPGLDIASLRQKHGLEGHRVILSVARLVERKGHAQIIRALPELIRRIPGLVYLIVGDGPERPSLEKLAEAMHLQPYVRFAGAVPACELPGYYNACALFALLPYEIPDSGDVEGFGMVYLEASACGKAVIGTDCGGVREAVEDGKCGLLIPQNDRLAFIEAATALLADPELAGELGRYGRLRAERHFTWPAVASRLEAVWEQAVRKDSHVCRPAEYAD